MQSFRPMKTTADISPTRLAEAIGISQSYASQLLSGARPISAAQAIKAYRATGVRLSPIAEATEAEIEVLERFTPGAA